MRRRGRAAAVALAHLAVPAAAAAETTRQVEVGVENLYYRTYESPLNRANLLGLRPDEDLLRGLLGWKETRGPVRGVFRGFVERRLGARPATEWTIREGYLQATFGALATARVGKQRLAWGSGFAWNPTNRLERPKNPLNTGLEQEGAEAVRVDVTPTAWLGIIAVGAQGRTGVGDLPFETPGERRKGGALRARALVRDTDVALVVSGGRGQRTLVGLDLGRTVAQTAVHLEASTYRGAELPPAREGRTFVRVATGALRSWGTTSLALEYFYNGEGYSAGERRTWLEAVRAAGDAVRPELPADLRETALARYAALATLPYAGGLGLRRHYLHAALTRGTPGGRWTLAARTVVGLSDGGMAVTPGVTYAPAGRVTLTLDGVVLVGPADSEYRLAPVRRAVQARAKVLF
jgi:hypothetical protein